MNTQHATDRSHASTVRGATRRRAFAQASGLVGAGLLAGACGGAGTGQTPAAPPASKPAGAVQFWHNWTTRTPLLRGYLDQFERENAGVKIEDTDVSTMGGRAKVPTAILSGTAPDILHLFVDMIPALAPSKALKPLGPYASRDKVNLKDYYDTEISARTVDGQLIAMPVVVAANAHFVYWNKERFRRAGLDPEKGPRSWAESLDMASKLTSRGTPQLGLDPGVPPGGDVFSNQFFRLLYHNGGRMFSEDVKKVAFAGPEGVEALEWMQQVINRQGTYDEVKANTGANPFYRGDLAMIVQQDNFGSQIRINDLSKNMAWGAALLPVNDRNKNAKVQTPAIGGHGYGIPTQAKNLEAAWQVVKYVTYGDGACGFLTRDQGRFSPLKKCADIPEVKNQPEFKVFAQGAQAGVFVPNTLANAQIATLVRDAIVSVYEGKASPKAALEDAARTSQTELDKAGAPTK
jgi:ABC-type glycerol-3-phosphate transport system substrate-binding protein